MPAVPSAQSERTLGDILRELMDGTRDLVKKETELARAELREAAAHAKRGAVFLGAATLLAIAGLILVELAAFELLALALPRWVSALAVGFVTLAIAGVLAKIGASRMKKVEPVPKQAIEEGERTGREVKNRLQEGLG